MVGRCCRDEVLVMELRRLGIRSIPALAKVMGALADDDDEQQSTWGAPSADTQRRVTTGSKMGEAGGDPMSLVMRRGGSRGLFSFAGLGLAMLSHRLLLEFMLQSMPEDKELVALLLL